MGETALSAKAGEYHDDGRLQKRTRLLTGHFYISDGSFPLFS